ncbi:MAG TPA: hypothetical protein VF084_04305 [Nitrososphaeraceae archaeon]
MNKLQILNKALLDTNSMKFNNYLTTRLGRIFLFALIGVSSYFSVTTITFAAAQEKNLNIIVTFFDINDDTGDVITFINSDGFTKAKLFTPLKSTKMGNTTELQFNLTTSQVSMGEQFRVCALLVDQDGIICKIGENSEAERPEIIDFRLATDDIVKIDVENVLVQDIDDTDNDNDNDEQDGEAKPTGKNN